MLLRRQRCALPFGLSGSLNKLNRSDLGAFGQCQRVLDIHTEVLESGFNLGVTENSSNCSGLSVFRCTTMARVRIYEPATRVPILIFTRSHSCSLLSIAR